MARGQQASALGSETYPHVTGGGHGSAVDLEEQPQDEGDIRQNGSREQGIPDARAQGNSYLHSWYVGGGHQTARSNLRLEVQGLRGVCASKRDSGMNFVAGGSRSVAEDTRFAAEDKSFVAEERNSVAEERSSVEGRR